MTKQSDIDYDPAEQAGPGGQLSMLDNFRHLRQAVATLFGGNWGTALANRLSAILSNGQNAGPTLQMPDTTINASIVNTTGGAEFLGPTNINTLGTGVTTIGNLIGPSVTHIGGGLDVFSDATVNGLLIAGQLSVSGQTLQAMLMVTLTSSSTSCSNGNSTAITGFSAGNASITTASAVAWAAQGLVPYGGYLYAIVSTGSIQFYLANDTGSTITYPAGVKINAVIFCV